MAQSFSQCTPERHYCQIPLDNASQCEFVEGPPIAFVSRVGYYDYLWRYCGRLPWRLFFLSCMIATTHSIKGAALPTKSDSIYTRNINELSQVSLAILLLYFWEKLTTCYYSLSAIALTLCPTQAALPSPFRLFASHQYWCTPPKSLTLSQTRYLQVIEPSE